jgi:hypothetical protein
VSHLLARRVGEAVLKTLEEKMPHYGDVFEHGIEPVDPFTDCFCPTRDFRSLEEGERKCNLSNRGIVSWYVSVEA